MSHVVNQVGEESRPVLSAHALEGAFKHYVEIMGAMPAVEDECTAEQLTAARALLGEGAGRTEISHCGALLATASEGQ